MDKGGFSLAKPLPIFYSALLLTCVNLLLRAAGTSFQVYLSATIGAAGIGLLQLTMSVGSLAMVAGMGGVRTATMYLTADELGRGKQRNVAWVLSGYCLYSIAFSGTVGLLLYCNAPRIAEGWIGDSRTVDSLRLFAGFLPTTCLCGVMTGYFTAANRIGTLAAIEVAEQLASMSITLGLLHFWSGSDAGRACLCVILGSSLGGCFTLICLIFLRLRERTSAGPRIPVAGRLLRAGLPLAIADDMKSGINTLENLMVPKRLALHSLTSEPLAAFGLVSGMVFPVLMFPACILFALAELLIPELARCAAADSRERISYLVRRSLKVASLYGFLFSGLMFLIGQPLCLALYGNEEAGRYLKLYALLIPMLYCDAITDAMTKGLGQQAVCVRYNILTSAMDVALLYCFLPVYGMMGYYLSFLVTHLINFSLSLRRLLKITGLRISPKTPVLAMLATAGAVWLISRVPGVSGRIVLYPIVLFSLLTLLGIVDREDLSWILRLPGTAPGSKKRRSA